MQADVYSVAKAEPAGSTYPQVDPVTQAGAGADGSGELPLVDAGFAALTLREGFERYLQSCERPTPEDRAFPSWLTKIQVLDGEGTPRSPLHTALIEPIFGNFVDTANSSSGPPEGHYLEAAARLLTALRVTDAHEAIQRSELLRTLGAALGNEHTFTPAYIPATNPSAPPYRTQGSVCYNDIMACNVDYRLNYDAQPLQNTSTAYRYFALHTVRESDGHLHAAEEFVREGVYPSCFQLSVYGGAVLCIKGAVLAPPYILSSVLATVHLMGEAQSVALLQAARVLKALREGLAAFQARYDSWKSAHSRKFDVLPVARHVGDLLPKALKISAFSPAAPADAHSGAGTVQAAPAPAFLVNAGPELAEGRLVFRVGVTDKAGASKGPVILKLVYRYGDGDNYGTAAHAAAAAAGHAPALLGSERLPGGWTAVLMEFLDPADGWRQYEPSDDSQRAAALAAYEDAVAGKGFVHGDLRMSNVLVAPHLAPTAPRKAANSTSATTSAESSGAPGDYEGSGWRVKFIDWDWAGERDKSLYPWFIDPEVMRPFEAEAGDPILPEHDRLLLAMLKTKQIGKGR